MFNDEISVRKYFLDQRIIFETIICEIFFSVMKIKTVKIDQHYTDMEKRDVKRSRRLYNDTRKLQD